MPFKDSREVFERLSESRLLSEQELSDMLPFMFVLGELRNIPPLFAHLALMAMAGLGENRKAIKEFDDSSKMLTRQLVWLTRAGFDCRDRDLHRIAMVA